MKRLLLAVAIAALLGAPAPLSLTAVLQAQDYQPNWDSVDRRPTPPWFDDAKFGIFIHWGVYSVPAYAPPKAQGGDAYAEWYWKHLEDKNGETWKFHVKTYGASFRYQDFADRFNAEVFDPDHWADVFARSGAKYVVLTSKHHEGFCLWPSAQSWNWNAVDVGPHRDLAGDLARAVTAHGLRMGFYYSLYEWYNPLYHSEVNRYVTEHMLPQMRDLVERYRPSVLWTDGEWDEPSSVWHSPEFLAWLFNESPVRDYVAVNDRWGKETRSHHGGFYTTEYGDVHLGTGIPLAARHKFEECRGMGKSFGYNRMEGPQDYHTTAELIHLLMDEVSGGGNLLLDIGPTADGRIPVIMEERLLEMGDWLKINGAAVYGTRPWRESLDGNDVRYTRSGNAVYAVIFARPGARILLKTPTPSRATNITMLGATAATQWSRENGKIALTVPVNAPAQPAYVFRLSAVQ